MKAAEVAPTAALPCVIQSRRSKEDGRLNCYAYEELQACTLQVHPISSTTFSRSGRRQRRGAYPDLVSEKSFEWHAEPYVAASAYAFMVGTSSTR
jgi:hypothetical protein